MSTYETQMKAHQAAALYYTGRTAEAMQLDAHHQNLFCCPAERILYMSYYREAAEALKFCPVPLDSIMDEYELQDVEDGMTDEDRNRAALLIEIREALEAFELSAA